MNSNCSLLIFLINSQGDVLALSACVWMSLDCQVMGWGHAGREVSCQLPEGTQGLCLSADPTASSFSAAGPCGPRSSPLLPWA